MSSALCSAASGGDGRSKRTIGASLIVLVIALLSTTPSSATQERPAIVSSVAARSIQPGEVVRLDMRCTCGDATPAATAFGRDVPLFSTGAGGWRGLIGIDLDTAPGAYPIVMHAGEDAAAVTHTLDVTAKQFRVRRLRVSGRFVSPPASVEPRIIREAALLDGIFSSVSPRGWDLPFRLPVTQAAISNFGTRSVFNGQPRSPHGGVDFASPTGTPIAAPAAGRIALAMPLYFTGNTVVMDHGQGIYSLFAHLSKIAVTPEEHIDRGAIVGLVGATGRVTGPHLHWTVRLHGARVDPLSLVAAMNETTRGVRPLR